MVKVKPFRVVYEIDVDAGDPVEAARLADEIMKDPAALPPVLDVYSETGQGWRVDLAGDKPEVTGLPAKGG